MTRADCASGFSGFNKEKAIQLGIPMDRPMLWAIQKEFIYIFSEKEWETISMNTSAMRQLQNEI